MYNYEKIKPYIQLKNKGFVIREEIIQIITPTKCHKYIPKSSFRNIKSISLQSRNLCSIQNNILTTIFILEG